MMKDLAETQPSTIKEQQKQLLQVVPLDKQQSRQSSSPENIFANQTLINQSSLRRIPFDPVLKRINKLQTKVNDLESMLQKLEKLLDISRKESQKLQQKLQQQIKANDKKSQENLQVQLNKFKGELFQEFGILPISQQQIQQIKQTCETKIVETKKQLKNLRQHLQNINPEFYIFEMVINPNIQIDPIQRRYMSQMLNLCLNQISTYQNFPLKLVLFNLLKPHNIYELIFSIIAIWSFGSSENFWIRGLNYFLIAWGCVIKLKNFCIYKEFSDKISNSDLSIPHKASKLFSRILQYSITNTSFRVHLKQIMQKQKQKWLFPVKQKGWILVKVIGYYFFGLSRTKLTLSEDSIIQKHKNMFMYRLQTIRSSKFKKITENEKLFYSQYMSAILSDQNSQARQKIIEDNMEIKQEIEGRKQNGGGVDEQCMEQYLCKKCEADQVPENEKCENCQYKRFIFFYFCIALLLVILTGFLRLGNFI